ncbi:hypothetical protein GLAREA_03163 [Glarea lozoyensis ATCC 20868]|uniref:Uncharacterized protein n=1 Tax=Glarea lozoyensis (strain ATCC 20868 / MF5171) TaxID=1116229 RepID=S3DL18_GLAL2|nr:uncharacterized protein GLAREA_03163 [Glarea lozoyensis ATCC 20868]EPE27248.1 hypothetical protein GLAREA_03163 [Glarea lozoyensis ATCC 20868]
MSLHLGPITNRDLRSPNRCLFCRSQISKTLWVCHLCNSAAIPTEDNNRKSIFWATYSFGTQFSAPKPSTIQPDTIAVLMASSLRDSLLRADDNVEAALFIRHSDDSVMMSYRVDGQPTITRRGISAITLQDMVAFDQVVARIAA